MLIRDLIGRIGETYDRALGLSGEAQELLKKAPGLVERSLPAGLIVGASGGKGVAATVPWISVFDPEETDTAQRGMYVVYLFDAVMKTVALSLNQGVTELVDRYGVPEGRRKLASQASAIRENLPPLYLENMQATIDLRSGAPLPRHYEAGNIIARTYDLHELPDESVVLRDLKLFVSMYEFARDVRDSLRISQPDTIATTKVVAMPKYASEFKPRDDDEYVQYITKQKLIKRRDHETVIRRYVPFLQSKGFVVCNQVHPRDLTAERDGVHWLVEVKVVYRNNGVEAARAALAQLLMYQDFLYPASAPVRLLAVFSEDIGQLCVDFLEKFGIASVWKDGEAWSGSPLARSGDLTSPMPA